MTAICNWKIGGRWWHREQIDEMFFFPSSARSQFVRFILIFNLFRNFYCDGRGGGSGTCPQPLCDNSDHTYRAVRSTDWKINFFPQMTEMRSLPWSMQCGVNSFLRDISKSKPKCNNVYVGKRPKLKPFAACVIICRKSLVLFVPKSCRAPCQGKRCDAKKN